MPEVTKLNSLGTGITPRCFGLAGREGGVDKQYIGTFEQIKIVKLLTLGFL